MTVRVVGVHGIGNYRKAAPDVAAAAMGEAWADFLNIDTGKLAVAYYANHLRLGGHGSSATDIEAVNAAMGDLPRRILESWIAELGWASSQPQGWGAAPLRGMVDWIVRRFNLDRPLVENFVAMFLTEVGRYFDPRDPGPRQAARAAVATAISTYKPSVVVAHSLGSVVTYEALWAYPALKVDLLITVGSPLALPGTIFPKLEPPPIDGRGNRPPGVRQWKNFADVGDPVAVPKNLGTFFLGVNDDVSVATGILWSHKAGDYLQHRLVRAAVSRLLL